MTVLTGANFYLEFAGVPVLGDYRKFDSGLELETVDGSAGGDSVRVEVATLFKVRPKLTMIIDNDAYGLAIRAVMKEGQAGNLIWGPYGNTAGLPKWGITCAVAKATPMPTYDKEQEMEIEFYNTLGTFLYDGRTITF